MSRNFRLRTVTPANASNSRPDVPREIPITRRSASKAAKYRTLLLFGAPGAGKGTQGRILGMIPHFFHCACGDVFRNLRPDSELGRAFLEFSKRGELVPDEQTVELWRQSIDVATKTGRFHPATDTLVLDGIPRSLSQAEILRDILDVKAVFYLCCDDPQKLVQRIQRRALKENRLDDANLEVVRVRLETYERDTKPLLEFYGNRLIHRIDAAQSPASVLCDILGHTRKLQPA